VPLGGRKSNKKSKGNKEPEEHHKYPPRTSYPGLGYSTTREMFHPQLEPGSGFSHPAHAQYGDNATVSPQGTTDGSGAFFTFNQSAPAQYGADGSGNPFPFGQPVTQYGDNGTVLPHDTRAPFPLRQPAPAQHNANSSGAPFPFDQSALAQYGDGATVRPHGKFSPTGDGSGAPCTYFTNGDCVRGMKISDVLNSREDSGPDGRGLWE